MSTETEFELIQGKLRSLVEWDVLQFFHHNPHAVESAQHIATALGREVGGVDKALQAMHRNKLIEKKDVQDLPYYRLTSDSRLRADIVKFMHACDDPSFRRSVIEQIVSRAKGQ